MGELVEGSPAHRPLSSKELVEWQALWGIRLFEAEREAKSQSL